MSVGASTHISGPPGFDVTELCGRGATSRVYRAVERAVGRVVALKRLHRHLIRDAGALARLRRELDALNRVRHPGLVVVHDVIRWDGDPTLVLEFVEGEDLKARLDREGTLSPAEAEGLARDLLDVLATAHGAGIVHRDLKPANIRLGVDGQVRLLDFGSARLDAASQLTATGTSVGTPDYMAPELFAGPVYDPRVDLYGLGATLFECLTGRPPHASESLAELAWRRASEDAPPVAELAADVPEALALLVDRCLSRDPGQRHPSAGRALFGLHRPDVERAFLARRAAQPPCLHCDTPLPPEAATCPRCGSAAPFVFPEGTWHIDVASLAEPAAFVEDVAARFPERASRSQVRALCQRVAALATSKQRYASFMAADAARAEVARLQRLGCTAEASQRVRLPEGAWLLLFPPAICLWLFVAATSPITGFTDSLGLLPWFLVGPLLVLLFDVRLSLAGAAGGILAVGRLGKPVRPGLLVLGVGWAVAEVARLGYGIVDPRWFVDHYGFAEVCELGLAVGTAISLQLLAYDERPLDRSPEPGLRARVRLAWRRVAPRRVIASRPLRLALGRLAGLALGMVLLFTEAGLLLRMQETPWFGPTEARVPRRRADALPERPSEPSKPRATRGRSIRAEAPAPDVEIDAAWSTALDLGLLHVGAAALLIGLAWRRRRRLRRAGDGLLADLDVASLRRFAARSAPPRNVRRGAGPPPGDALTREARPPAAGWRDSLDEGQRARLDRSLRALVGSGDAALAADRSLLARCVLEADPEQSARLAFLALEGELESEAATRWAAGVPAAA